VVGKAAVKHIFIIPSTQFLYSVVIIVGIAPAVVKKHQKITYE
jgi:hypothetical protein